MSLNSKYEINGYEVETFEDPESPVGQMWMATCGEVEKFAETEAEAIGKMFLFLVKVDTLKTAKPRRVTKTKKVPPSERSPRLSSSGPANIRDYDKLGVVER